VINGRAAASPAQGLVRGQPALVDAALDSALDLEGGLGAEGAFEQDGGSVLVPQGPGEMLVKARKGVVQSEEVEVSSESFDDLVGAWRLVSGHGGFFFRGRPTFAFELSYFRAASCRNHPKRAYPRRAQIG
jgi:hypothetical protein